MPNTLSPDALILAIDVGSSSVRALVADPHGQVLADSFVQLAYDSTVTSDGGSTFDPAAVCRAIFDCIDRVIVRAGESAERIRLVAMDTLVSNILGIGKDGQPTTPVYTWADVRGRELIPELKKTFTRFDYSERTGCYVHPSYWPLRLLWLHNHEPDAFNRTAYWLSLGEYVLYQLFGERRVSLSTASWSGLLNRRTLDWDEPTLAALPIQREQLSAISDQPFEGTLSRWPVVKNVRWLPSIGDGVASNIGAGCSTSSRVALALGTSGALRIIIAGTPDRLPDGLFCYRVDANRSLLGGALSNVGNLYAWMRNTFGIKPDADLDPMIGKIAPDSHGLTILPFLMGERAPGWNDRAQAAFVGMTGATRPEELIRAGLEAVAYRFYQIASRLKSFLPPGAIYVAGGAAVGRSPVWMQILADVLGAPIHTAAEVETTIRGTVFFAAGGDPPFRVSQEYAPDMARHAIYQEAIDRQQGLYEKLFRPPG